MNIIDRDERPESERGKEMYMYIDMIEPKELRDFVTHVLNTYSNEDNLFEANMVADTLLQILRKKKLISGNTHQNWVDVLLAATMMHNIYFDQEDWVTLFDARAEIEPIAKEYGMIQQVIDSIFQTIEAQMGDDTPVPACRPNHGTPQELFATAVWIVKEYKPQG